MIFCGHNGRLTSIEEGHGGELEQHRMEGKTKRSTLFFNFRSFCGGKKIKKIK